MRESAPARVIPSIDRLRQRQEVHALETRFGPAAVTDALRAAAGALRDRLQAGGPGGAAPTADAAASLVVEAAATRLERDLGSRLRRVINATGVIVHTNLGRAPLSDAAIARISEASGYTALELDLATGKRGRRDTHAEGLICRLTGAEAAVVVNNNAAATLLMITALAEGREAIVSRGELVEIGGGFRVPDIMRQSGAILREVGTTNRTRAADYAAAISDRTGLLLRVHPSNFSIEGFTERPSLADLVAIARRHGVPLAEDLGSGLLEAASIPELDEPDVASSVRAGVDIVAFSADKLLGGPQGGIVAGRRALVELVRRHPLMRALRVDKLTYAALEATLLAHARGTARDEVPVLRMLTCPLAAIAERADQIAARLVAADWHAETLDGWSAVGGGAAPSARLPTRLVAIARGPLRGDALLTALRCGTPAIVARIESDRVVLDLRTVAPWEDDEVVQALADLGRS